MFLDRHVNETVLYNFRFSPLKAITVAQKGGEKWVENPHCEPPTQLVLSLDGRLLHKYNFETVEKIFIYRKVWFLFENDDSQSNTHRQTWVSERVRSKIYKSERELTGQGDARKENSRFSKSCNGQKDIFAAVIPSIFFHCHFHDIFRRSVDSLCVKNEGRGSLKTRKTSKIYMTLKKCLALRKTTFLHSIFRAVSQHFSLLILMFLRWSNLHRL